MRRATVLVAAFVLVASTASRAVNPRVDDARRSATPPLAPQAATTLGPDQCLNCHDHQKEDQWYKTREMLEVQRLFPDRGKQAGHINSMNQLELPASKGFLKAVAMTDAYDVKGKCVTCHATVINGQADAGVSCESCHGPASAYLKLHQRVGAYQQAVAAGMVPVISNIDAWAKQCQGCHIVTDDRLVKAGHPSGKDFDLSVKFQPVALHFKSKRYTPGDVSAVWARLRPVPTPIIVAPPPPPPAPPPTPPPTSTPTPPVTPVVTPAVTTAPKVTTTVSPPPKVTTTPVKPPPVVTPTPDPVVTPAPIVNPAPPPAPPAPSAADPSAALSAVQGRLIAALTKLLTEGATLPARVRDAAAPVPYNGPDAALLQLQAEAIALALQVLGQAPPKPRGGGL